MAIVKSGSWLNEDGLAVDFGLDEARYAKVTEYREDGPARCLEVTMYDVSQYATGNDYVLSSKVSLPKGARITKVLVGPSITDFASSGSGTVSIGTIDKDQASNGDNDSIILTASVAEMNNGEVYPSVSGTQPSPVDGALVQGVALTSAKFLTITIGTAVFQAGSGTVRIWYELGKPVDDNLVWDKSGYTASSIS